MDRDGDQRGQREWEPIKICSKEELGLCPKSNPPTSLIVNSRSRSYERATYPGNSLGGTAETDANNTDPNTANEHKTKTREKLPILGNRAHWFYRVRTRPTGFSRHNKARSIKTQGNDLQNS